MEYEVVVLPADKHKCFLQVDSITLIVGSQGCQKYPNNKFTIFLQYLKENMKDEVDFFFFFFLPSDKCQGFLQIDTIILGVLQGISKLRHITSLQLLCNIKK